MRAARSLRSYGTEDAKKGQPEEASPSFRFLGEGRMEWFATCRTAHQPRRCGVSETRLVCEYRWAKVLPETHSTASSHAATRTDFERNLQSKSIVPPSCD